MTLALRTSLNECPFIFVPCLLLQVGNVRTFEMSTKRRAWVIRSRDPGRDFALGVFAVCFVFGLALLA